MTVRLTQPSSQTPPPGRGFASPTSPDESGEVTCRRLVTQNEESRRSVSLAVAIFCILVVGTTAIAVALYPLAPQVTARAIVIFAFTTLLVGSVWSLVRVRRIRLRTLVVFVPMGVAMVWMPVYQLRRGHQLERQLKRMGVGYRLEPTALEAILNSFVSDFLGKPRSSIWESELISLEIDLGNLGDVRWNALELDRLSRVSVHQTVRSQRIPSELVQWLTELPREVDLSLLLSGFDQQDSMLLSGLERPIKFLYIHDQSLTNRQMEFVLGQALERLVLETVHIPAPFEPREETSPALAMEIHGNALVGSQIVALAGWKRCRDLAILRNQAGLTLEDCSMLAQLPLRSITISGQGLTAEHVGRLLKCKTLTKLSVGRTNMSDVEIQTVKSLVSPSVELKIGVVE